MSNARPSRRDLQAYQKALQVAASQSANISPLKDLERARDAYLASLR
jgi:hypothetical protein